MKKIVYGLSLILLVLLALSVSAESCTTCTTTCTPCGGGCTATSLRGMFYGVTNFDATVGDITSWDTSCITDMSYMFQKSDFNQDIGGWDTSSVTAMEGMFSGDLNFNQDINGWDTSKVTTLNGMFFGSKFNSPVGEWETASVTNMGSTFAYSDFDQDISGWNVSNVLSMAGMFMDVKLSTRNYDALLLSWSQQLVHSGLSFDAGRSQYSEYGKSGWDILSGVYGWSLADAGQSTCEPFWVCSDYGSCIQGTRSCSAVFDINYCGKIFRGDMSLLKVVCRNEEDCPGITSDTSAPTTVSDAPVEWRNTEVVVSLSASDYQCGVQKTFYCVDETNTCVPNIEGNELTVSTEGTSYVRFLSIDNSTSGRGYHDYNYGNPEQVVSNPIMIDKSLPDISVSVPMAGATYVSGTGLDFEAIDRLSGVAYIVGELTDFVGSVLSVYPGFAPLPGAYRLIVTAIDYAGNRAETGPVDFVVTDVEEDCPGITSDTSAPTTIAAAPAEWSNTNVLVSLSASDSECGIQTTLYCVDETNTCEPNIAGTHVTVTAERVNYVRYLSIDNSKSGKGYGAYAFGNVEEVSSTIVRIDKTNPLISVSTPQNYGLYILGTQLQFSATDSLSGIASVKGELTNTLGTKTTVTNGYMPAEGVYTLTVTAVDQAGNTVVNSPINFVVYDPNGGFATGGGWILPDLESTLPGGKANFGFVAKYKDKVSDGNLEFQYKDANINLKSTSIDWLVISGVSAQFQGTATINGQGTYTFRVLAKDNAEPGTNKDTFDITIWSGKDTGGNPVHKAKNTIAGGNIVVHKK